MAQADRPAGVSFPVWVAVFTAIGISVFHGHDDAKAQAALPGSFPAEIVGDTQVDSWRVSDFTRLFAFPDRGRVEDDTIPGGGARRIAVPAQRKNLYDISIYSRNSRPIHQGDRIAASVWMRLAPVDNNPKVGRARLLIQAMDAPYGVVSDSYVTIGRHWRRYTVRGIADRDYAPGHAVITAHLAAARQTVDIGHGQLYDFDLPGR